MSVYPDRRESFQRLVEYVKRLFNIKEQRRIIIEPPEDFSNEEVQEMMKQLRVDVPLIVGEIKKQRDD